MRYLLPPGMEYSSLSERKEYYKGEFRFDRVVDWFGDTRDPLNTAYAAIIGRHTGIFPKKFEKRAIETILLDSYSSLLDVRNALLELLPEGVYYDRNYYQDLSKCSDCKYYTARAHQPDACWRCRNFIGQELAFDMDPENVVCPIHGGLEEKMTKHQGLAFCETELDIVRDQTARLYEELEGRFEEMKIVYSGRGFHIHVLDEKTKKWTRRERRKLATEIGKKYAIDEWVTAGGMRLIRLPYSLHGMVSRVVLPLKIKELVKFDPIRQKGSWPLFLRK